ncbi:hypothetical protein ANCDUO_02080 [Ancylostoma duodenale]|uniref:Paired domain-containing protein n=1 Tax=Ancylostoma duodenale TaxID=51022 RepID=A0A0C2H7N1_9BILA|nr:hypothetical protein ANCDUO_02080 [Ancylostoma duodenale]
MARASAYRDAIIQLFCSGVPARDISNQLKVSRKVVSIATRRYEEPGTNSDRKRSGRPVTVRTGANVKKIRDRLRRNPARSIRKISREIGITRTIRSPTDEVFQENRQSPPD